MKSVKERLPTLGEADIVVLGGGPAGIAAAVAAARMGVRTILVERYGFLGGGGTMVGASAFDGLHANVNGQIKQVVHGVVDEILERIDLLDGLNRPHLVQNRIYAQSYDVSAWKIAADEFVLESGVKVLFHCLAVGVDMLGDRIRALILETKSGRCAVHGSIFIDCSGDADLTAWSGAPFRKGDENGFLQSPAMLFRLAGVDNSVAEASLPRIEGLMEEANRSGEFDLPRIASVLRPLKHKGEWRANLTKVTRNGGVLDGTDVIDLTYAEIEGRRQVKLYWDFLRKKVPGFERSYVVDVGPEIGVRETRRLDGAYQLMADDITNARSFHDAIGVSGWPVERHTETGIEWHFPIGRGYHQIPYRCMLPIGVGNMLVAGRCISAEPDAQAAIRVSGPCFVTGEAAGTAAAIAMNEELAPSAISTDVVQTALLTHGAFIG